MSVLNVGKKRRTFEGRYDGKHKVAQQPKD